MHNQLEPIKGHFALPLEHNHDENFNLQSQIAELKQPLAKVGQVVKEWYGAYHAGRLQPEHYKAMLPILEALMLLPEQTRLDLCGENLEELYSAAKEVA